MTPRFFLRPVSVARKALTPIMRGCVTRIQGLISPTAATPAQTAVTSMPLTATTFGTPHVVSAEHADILAMLEETARLGHVPADALIGRLHACHGDRLAQDRQQLVALEQELESHLARLDARFPVPRPEPEQPVPVRGRKFGPISRDLRTTVPGTDTRQ